MTLVLAALCLAQADQPFTHESWDGFKIDARLSSSSPDVTRVVILLGGSGPYDMDQDLTEVTRHKTKNLWLRDVSDGLVARGFATIRYHKRPFQMRSVLAKIKAEKREPNEEEKALYNRTVENPLKAFVEDCKSFAEAARKRFPKAKIYLLGHSEGTHVALWAAHELPWISGVALVGFYAKSLDVGLFEQIVWRDESYFRGLDRNNDGMLTREEMTGDVGKQLLGQLAYFDFDQDGAMSVLEYRAIGMFRLDDFDVGDAYRRQEAAYPTMNTILKKSQIPIAFFQGMWDNQTPVYHAQGTEALAKHKWKKTNLTFRYFPKLGHELDPRESYYDLLASPIDAEALKTMAADLDSVFR